VTHRVQPYYAPARIYFLDGLRSKDFEFFSFHLNETWNDRTIYRYLVALGSRLALSIAYRSTIAIGSFDRSFDESLPPGREKKNLIEEQTVAHSIRSQNFIIILLLSLQIYLFIYFTHLALYT